MLAGELARFTVDEFLAACQREGVAAAKCRPRPTCSPGRTCAPAATSPRSSSPARRASSVEAPTPPWRYAADPAPAAAGQPGARRAHRRGACAEWQPRRAGGGHAATTDAGPAPLAGLRVVDMTWVWAGPFAAMQFAHLGADVVKLESTSRVDVTRRLGPFADGEVDIDRSGYFNQYNQGKRSVVLDVKQPRGMALLEAGRSPRADLIIDNMRPGVAGPDGPGPRRRCARSTHGSSPWR